MLSRDRLVEILLAQLDERERAGSIVYYTETPVAAGSAVGLPRLDVEAPWDALLGFVDRVPTANWSHSCRYVLVSSQTGEVLSIEAQLPPFGPTETRPWRVAYKAPSVPDAAVTESVR
jgi:hypothetical protein